MVLDETLAPNETQPPGGELRVVARDPGECSTDHRKCVRANWQKVDDRTWSCTTGETWALDETTKEHPCDKPSINAAWLKKRWWAIAIAVPAVLCSIYLKWRRRGR